MNRVIVSSSHILKKLTELNKINFYYLILVASKKEHTITIDDKTIDCEVENDFTVWVYKKKVASLINHLRLIEDQPVTLYFKDSETFNIKICEMYI